MVLENLYNRVIEKSQVLAPGVFRRRIFREEMHPSLQAIESKRVDFEMILMQLFLKKDNTRLYIDIGANIGSYVAAVYSYLPKKSILAFEPNPHMVKRFQILFPNIKIEPIALSSTNGTARFKVPYIKGKLYETRGTLATYTEDGEDGTQEYSVATETLDSYCDRNHILNIGIIKIDVEGYEEEIIAGAEAALIKQKPIIIAEIEQRHHIQPIQIVFNKLLSLGYEGWFFDIDRWEYVSINQFTVNKYQNPQNEKTVKYVQNFVFTPSGMSLPAFPSRSSLASSQ